MPPARSRSLLPSCPAPRHHPAALTPPAAIYSPIFPQKKQLRFIWDARRCPGQKSPCRERCLHMPLVGARGGTAGSAPAPGVGLPQHQGPGQHRGLRSLLPRGCHQQSTRPQGGWENPPEKPPVRREAAGPRRLGLRDEKSLRWLCWPLVDSSWLSWGLKATLKLSKQTLISQFSQPACNLSLALLYRGVEQRPAAALPLLQGRPCSEHQEQQWPGHGQGAEGSSCPVSQHHSSVPDKASYVLWGMAQTSTRAG